MAAPARSKTSRRFPISRRREFDQSFRRMRDVTASSPLAQSITLRGTKLRNRILFAPMERNYCTTDGRLTEQYNAYLADRAAGGAAVVFTEASYVRVDGKGRRRQMGVHDDSVIPGIKRLAEIVHHKGSLLGIELNHGGNTSQGAITGYQPLAPSPVACQVAGGEVPLELDIPDIHSLVADFAAAASRCTKAGVDVLSLHAAHGYLIHQFMSPRTNRREDEYRDPVRFLNEVLTAVRETAPDCPLGIRISALDGTEDGLGEDATFNIISRARLDLIDFIDVSAGCYEAGEWIVQPGEWEEGLLASRARRYKAFGKPIGVAGRIVSRETAERIVSEGDADLVSLARALHAAPDWPLWALGERPPPRPCIACQLCIDELGSHGPIRCSVNPDAGHEYETPSEREVMTDGEVVIVGAGPAGLELACTLVEGGRRVRLVERENRIGGQFALAASVHEYPQYHRILDWYEAKLQELAIGVEFGCQVDPTWLQAAQPKTLAIAIGAPGHIPVVDGISNARVIDVREWLRRRPAGPIEGMHVIWGADREGTAVADDLVTRGARVLVVQPRDALAPDVGRRAKILVVPRLMAHPSADIRLATDVRQIEDDRLLLVKYGREEWVTAAGPVIVSHGVSPATALIQALRAACSSANFHLIGDAAGRGGSIADAIADGRRLGRLILYGQESQ